MAGQTTKKIVRTAGFLLLLAAVGIAGVLLGPIVRDRLAESGKPMGSIPVPVSLLGEDLLFPDVALVGPGGRQVYSGSLLGEGSVVLFLDLECPPCEDMISRWQKAADNGFVGEGQLWGITYFPQSVVESYAAANDIRFPIYVDSLQTFLHKYEVNRFPLEVVVGASGHIRSTNYNAGAPLDLDRLMDKLED